MNSIIKFCALLVFALHSSLYAQTNNSKIIAELDLFKRTYEDPLLGTFSWNPVSFNLIANDYITLNGVNTAIILTGPNKNATISKEGNWPTGITLSEDGIITIPSSTPRITQPFSYKICIDGGECSYSSILVHSMTDSNIENNQIEIVSGTANTCDGSNIKFDQKGTIPAGSIKYDYYISYDNGKSWTLGGTTNNAYDDIVFTVFEGTPVVIRRATNTSNDNVAFSTPIKLNVIKNHITFTGDNYFSIPKGTTLTLPQVSTSLPSTITITKPDGSVVPASTTITNTFNETGTYIYTIKAVDASAAVCTTYSNITVQVYEVLSCLKKTERVYATAQNWLTTLAGGVDDPAKAIDHDVFTKSIIVNGLALLGLGTTYQNLKFDNEIPAGTPIKIKLGQNYSLLQLAGGITVAPISNEVDPITNKYKQIGPLKSISEGALLDLLTGPNIFEHTYLATDYNGKQIPSYGVRVVLGSTLAIGATADVYEAYYDKVVDNPTGNPYGSDITVTGVQNFTNTGTLKLNDTTQDLLYGVEDIGLGVASALATVVNPYYAVDDDLNSYCSLLKAVGVANKKRLTVVLRQPARPGDQIRIIMGGQGIPVLDLDLINGFNIQRYNGNIKVGDPISGSQFRLLDLDLFNIFTPGDKRKVLLAFGTDQPFDRIEITDLSVVSAGLLGDITTDIYDVSILPSIKFEGQQYADQVTELCAGSFLQVMKVDGCTDYDVSIAFPTFNSENQITGYTEVANSGLTRIGESTSRIFYKFQRLYPEHEGNLRLKIQTKRNGFAYGEPQYMKISLKNCKSSATNPVIHTNR